MRLPWGACSCINVNNYLLLITGEVRSKPLVDKCFRLILQYLSIDLITAVVDSPTDPRLALILAALCLEVGDLQDFLVIAK